jgi:ADP-ribose pyrophosphatase YjhB (NUDIX family)
LPAGHLDGEETLRQAMVREAQEEINVTVAADALGLVHIVNRRAADHERVDFFFTAGEWVGEPKIMELDKCDDLRWFPLNGLPANITPEVRQALDHFKSGLNYSEIW